MYYIDTHCHIYGDDFKNIDEVIDESKNNNVLKMINNAENLETSYTVIDIAKKYGGIFYATVGIHPEYADNLEEDYLFKLEELIKSNKVIAIGEIGLDYHYTKENKEKQIKLFEEQLALAEKYNLPVIIHSRDATKDTIDSINKFNVRGSIHSFSGSYETALIYIKKGFKLGINGVVTFKNSNLKDVVKEIGLDNLLLETDSPFLSPEPFRGKKNSPKNVMYVGQFLSKLFDVNETEVMEKTSENARQVFDI